MASINIEEIDYNDIIMQNVHYRNPKPYPKPYPNPPANSEFNVINLWRKIFFCEALHNDGS